MLRRLLNFFRRLAAAPSLAPLLAELRAAGVVEASFHPDGRPQRLLLAPPSPPAAAPPGDGGTPQQPPGDPLFWSSRRRPGADR